MDWMTDVRQNLRKKNRILFSRDNEQIRELEHLLRGKSRRTVILWALDLAEESVRQLAAKYTEDPRPAPALESARLWAEGAVKMPAARRDILRCHAMAKELTDPADIALCHAVGQACSVVHTAGHAPGYPLYELTALVRIHGIDNCRDAVEERCAGYREKLRYWETVSGSADRTWADFLTEETERPSRRR